MEGDNIRVCRDSMVKFDLTSESRKPTSRAQTFALNLDGILWLLDRDSIDGIVYGSTGSCSDELCEKV